MGLVEKRLATWLCALAMGFALLLASPYANAQQSPAQRAQARELYSTGQQLFRQGNFESAQRSFEEAYRVVPNPVVLLSIAECQVRTEQYPAAIETLRTYLREKPNAPDKREVEGQIAALEAKPATLTVQSSVEGAAISVDAQETGRYTPSDLELSAGSHSISLSLEGYQPAEQSVTLSPGGRDTINLTLTPNAAPAVAEAPAEAPAPAAPSRRHATKAVWIATGVAGAGLVTGIILGGVALKKKSEFDQDPTEKLADTGERVALFADVGFGIAAAGGITALVLYLTSDRQSSEERSWSLKPNVSASKAGLIGRIRF